MTLISDLCFCVPPLLLLRFRRLRELRSMEDATSSPKSHAQQLWALFPEHSEVEIQKALEEGAGDMQQAAGILLQTTKAAPEGDELKAAEMHVSDYRALLESAETRLRELQTKENNYKDKYMGLLERQHCVSCWALPLPRIHHPC